MPKPSAADIPQALGVRLVRRTPSLILTFFLALFLIGIGVGAWVIKHRVEGADSWIFHLVSFVFGGIGLLMMWAFYRGLMAASIPPTIVELSEQPFILGQSAQVAVIQPGPARLRSLRVNLVCIQRATTYRRRSGNDGGNSRNVSEKLLSTLTLGEHTDLNVAAGDRFQEVREFDVPVGPPTSRTENVRNLWRIEVWGKGYGQASFKETFDVEVVDDERARQGLKKAYEDEAGEAAGD